MVCIAGCAGGWWPRSYEIPVDPASCAVMVQPSSGVPADGSHSATVTVILRDSERTPVPLKAVQVTATGSDNHVGQARLLTDERGIVTAKIVSTRAETKTILAVVNPGQEPTLLPQAPTIEFVEADRSDGASEAVLVESHRPGRTAVSPGPDPREKADHE